MRKPLLTLLAAVVVMGALAASFREKNEPGNLADRIQAELDASDKRTVADPEPELIGEPATASSASDNISLCRAAIAEMMGHDFSIVSGVARRDGNIGTRYVRPSDGSTWQNACRLESNRVVWASMDQSGTIGHWRTSPADEVITYALTTEGVMITQSFADDSAISGWFPRD
ncbi:MAG: hypothetical protein OEM24_05975 [Paracoccaceae bacterium]|nr:hypothetical protein [Paracoccaceae bacterium]